MPPWAWSPGKGLHVARQPGPSLYPRGSERKPEEHFWFPLVNAWLAGNRGSGHRSHETMSAQAEAGRDSLSPPTGAQEGGSGASCGGREEPGAWGRVPRVVSRWEAPCRGSLLTVVRVSPRL